MSCSYICMYMKQLGRKCGLILKRKTTNISSIMSQSISSLDLTAALTTKEIRLTIDDDENHRCSICCQGFKYSKVSMVKEMMACRHRGFRMACIESWIHYCLEIAMLWVSLLWDVLLRLLCHVLAWADSLCCLLLGFQIFLISTPFLFASQMLLLVLIDRRCRNC